MTLNSNCVRDTLLELEKLSYQQSCTIGDLVSALPSYSEDAISTLYPSFLNSSLTSTPSAVAILRMYFAKTLRLLEFFFSKCYYFLTQIGQERWLTMLTKLLTLPCSFN